MRDVLLSIVALFALSFPAQGSLIVDVYRGHDDKTSVWDFSGNAAAGGRGAFSRRNDISSAEFGWKKIGDFTDLENYNYTQGSRILGGNAVLSIGSETRQIKYVFIDNKNSKGDRFTVAVKGSSNFEFRKGDEIAWTGTIVTNIPLGDLWGPTSLPTDVLTFNSSTFGSGQNLGDIALTLNFHNCQFPSAAQEDNCQASGMHDVPEPSSVLSFGVIALTGIAMLWSQRRRSER